MSYAFLSIGMSSFGFFCIQDFEETIEIQDRVGEGGDTSVTPEFVCELIAIIEKEINFRKKKKKKKKGMMEERGFLLKLPYLARGKAQMR